MECQRRRYLVKFTKYFEAIRSRPDRSLIQDEWILRVVASPEREDVQADGRVRRWAKIEEMEGRYLRVVLLPDRETVHNTFFLAYPVRCQLRSRVSPAAAVEFFIRGG